MQTEFNAVSDRRVGMLAYAKASQPSMVVSKAATVAIPAGRFTSRDGGDDKAKLPTASGDVTATGFGFACWDPGRMPNTSAAEYAAEDTVPVLKLGYIFAESDDAGGHAYGDPVYVRFTTDTDGSDLGMVRGDADGGKAVALPGAYFDETVTGAGVVRVFVAIGGGAAGATGATGPTGPTG
jgi:hypothetical protein